MNIKLDQLLRQLQRHKNIYNDLFPFTVSRQTLNVIHIKLHVREMSESMVTAAVTVNILYFLHIIFDTFI